MRPRFRKKAPDTSALLVRVSRGMTQMEDPSAYLKLLARVIETYIEVSHVGVLLYHQGHTAYVFHTTRGRQRVPAGLVKLEATNPIVDWFRAQIKSDAGGRPEYLSREALENKKRTERDEKVLNEMKRLHSTICVPCFFRRDLVGLILIGSKIDNTSFTEEEIRLLLILSHHAAMGVRSAELHDTAMTDELTGTYNRRSFIRRLAEELERTRRYGRPVSLIMIDIDAFKRFNDRYGHTTGDFILRQLAELLVRGVRRVDIVCRYGGEEFSVILADTDLEKAKHVAIRLQSIIADEIWIADQVTVSMGIAADSGTDPSLSPPRLIERADQALYKAKTSGRNRIAIWTAAGPSLS